MIDRLWFRSFGELGCRSLVRTNTYARSHLSPDGGGVTRAAVHRLAADGYDLAADDSRFPAVATCRQTVEALLAPLSTAWQRMASAPVKAIE